jgi:hypothetical protein
MFSNGQHRFKLAGLLLLAAFATAPSTASAQSAKEKSGLANTVVLVIRHAEKPETGTGLTPAGEARAKAYAKYFPSYKFNGKPFHVDYIFATADSKNSFRERLTVEPLAAATKLKPDLRFKNKEYQELADAMRAKSYGRNIVICWHHGKIPDLLTALGADGAKLIPGGKWPAETFDWVVQLVYDANGKVVPSKSSLVPEHLMPGDK